MASKSLTANERAVLDVLVNGHLPSRIALARTTSEARYEQKRRALVRKMSHTIPAIVVKPMTLERYETVKVPYRSLMMPKADGKS